MQNFRALAEAAARAGGAVLQSHAGHITGLRAKSSARDLVSAADVASGITVARVIADSIEDARFIIEETEVYEQAGVAHGSLDEGPVWVIDPLDGTTSFVHSYPCWSVSIAYLYDGRPLAGAVYNVPADEMISAALGMGSTLGGSKLSCTGSPTLHDALLGTGFPYDRGTAFDRQMRLLERLGRPARDVRRDGSAAIDLCHVAAGRTDGFWETALQPWDMAAGVLIVEESGGVVSDFDGRPWTTATRDVVAANPALHMELLIAISDAEGRHL